MIQVLQKMVSALSVTPICPRCKGVIPSEDINVANDIAFCRNCDLSHSLSALTSGTIVDENVDVSRPPAGTWFQRDGNGVVIGATHRSISQAFGLLFFSLFWNGIVSVFVLLALASTLHHFGVPLPRWLPLSKGNSIPVGMTIFLWLFLTPFIAIGFAVLMTLLSCLAGRTEVRIQGGEGVLFTGVGPVGFRKRFSTSEVRDVRIEDRRWRDSSGSSQRKSQIVIETERKPISLGSMLSEERRRFIAGALKKELVRR
jgi:hypothetical protein